MTISFVNAGAGAGGTTSLTLAYPASPVAGNLLVLCVANKYPTNAPTTPSGGWVFNANMRATGGSGSAGIDVGSIYISVYTKIATGSESGNLTVTVTSGNASYGRIFQYTATTKNYDLYYVSGADNTVGNNNWSVTAGSDPGIIAGDMVLVASGINTDNYTFTSEAISATGISAWGTMAERHDAGTNSGQDVGMLVSEHPVTTGTSSAAPVFTATSSNNSTNNPAGASVFMRIREISALTVNNTAVSATVAPTVVTTSQIQVSWAEVEVPANQNVTVTPAVITAVGATVNPTVQLGSTIAIPAAITSVGATVNPTVVIGSQTVIPAVITSVGATVNPTVILGSITKIPAVITAVGLTIGPFFYSVTITPNPATAYSTMHSEVDMLDDFNRANENPISTNWTGPIFNSQGQMKLDSNQLAEAGSTNNNSYFTTLFDPDQQIIITHATIDTGSTHNWGVFTRLNNAPDPNGYFLYCEPSDARISIWRFDDFFNATNLIQTSQTYVNGYRFKFSSVGSVHTAYVDDGTGWAQVLQYTDGTYTGSGYLGIYSDHSPSTRFDDLSGGEFTDYDEPVIVIGYPSVSITPNPATATSSMLGLGSLIDNFNRADGALADSVNWFDDFVAWGATDHLIDTNQLGGSGASWHADRTGGSYSANQEVSITVSNVEEGGATTNLYNRIVNPGEFVTGYGAVFDPLNGTVKLERVDDDSTGVFFGTTGSYTIIDGDKIKLRSVGNHHTALVDSGSGWRVVAEGYDSTYATGGNLALISNSFIVRLDDFSGGSLTYIEPTVILGSITKVPAAISVVGLTVDPTLVFSSTTVNNPIATAVPSTSVTVVLGSMTVTPAVLTAVGSTVNPTVILGSLSFTRIATAVILTIDPTVVISNNDVYVTPDPISAVGTTTGPTVKIDLPITPTASSVVGTTSVTVVLGSMTVILTASSAVGATVNPVVILGSIAYIPAVLTVVASTVNPTVSLGSTTATPAPVTAIGVTLITVVLGSTSYTPSASTAVILSVNPTVILGSIAYTPTANTVVALTLGPTLVFSSTTATPSAASVVATTSITVILGSITYTPAIDTVVGSTVSPTLVFSSTTATPAPITVVMRTSVTIAEGGITYTPPIITAVGLSAGPSVVLGSVTISNPYITAIGLTASPTVVLGSSTASPAPATARVLTLGPTVQLGSLSITPSVDFVVGSSTNPNTILGSLSLVRQASARVSTIGPTLVFGSTTVVSPLGECTISTSGPNTIQGSLTLTPPTATVVISTLDPTVIQGSLTITPSADTVVMVTTGPTIFQNSITAIPDPVTAVMDTSIGGIFLEYYDFLELTFSIVRSVALAFAANPTVENEFSVARSLEVGHDLTQHVESNFSLNRTVEVEIDL